MSDLMELVKDCETLQYNEKAQPALEKASRLKSLGFDLIHAKLHEKARAAAKTNEIARHGYVRITDEKIKAFLRRKVGTYNKAYPRKEERQSRERRRIIEILVGPQPTLPNGFADYTLAPVLAQHDNTGVSLDMMNLGAPIGFPMPPRESLAKFGTANISLATIHRMSTAPDTIGSFQWEERRVEDYDAIPPDSALAALEQAQGKNVFDYFTVATVNAVKDPLLLGRVKGVKDRYFLSQWGDDVALDEVI